MAKVYSDAYWTHEFAVTQADLKRLVGFISEQAQAQDLSALLKRVVRGRLRYGHDASRVVAATAVDTATVQLWDPAGDWQVGDQAIVLRNPRLHVYETTIGEVIEADPAQVKFYLPSENKTATYQRAEAGSSKAQHWHTRVREVVAQKRAAEGEGERLDLIVLEHGERIAGLLLDALQQDERFVLLDGRWFLREQAVLPDTSLLHSLAWSLLHDAEPQPTHHLLARLPVNAPGDAAMFGLYLAFQQHPQWFRNTEPKQRPLWTLAGPPPGSFTPKYAAYDPDSYEILCLPGEQGGKAVVARLWETGLLTAVA